jgi:tetratricopeptide (TPR) repeat protein
LGIVSRISEFFHYNFRIPLGSIERWERALLDEIDVQLAAHTPLADIVHSLDVRCEQVKREAQALGKAALHSDKKMACFTKMSRWAECVGQHRNRLFQIMYARNVEGTAFERTGELDKAIDLYEANVADHCDVPHPYDRLRVIYTRQQNYADAIRVCRAYLNLPDDFTMQDKARFRYQLEKLLAR